MICPNCKYQQGYDKKHETFVNGTEGYFWEVFMKAVRPDCYTGQETRSVYACPKCGMLFIEV